MKNTVSIAATKEQLSKHEERFTTLSERRRELVRQKQELLQGIDQLPESNRPEDALERQVHADRIAGIKTTINDTDRQISTTEADLKEAKRQLRHSREVLIDDLEANLKKSRSFREVRQEIVRLAAHWHAANGGYFDHGQWLGELLNLEDQIESELPKARKALLVE